MTKSVRKTLPRPRTWFGNRCASPVSTWLRKQYLKRYARNPAYSQRSFAKLLGIPSGRLSEILTGKRPMTPALARQVADRMALSYKEAQALFKCVDVSRRAIRIQKDLTSDPIRHPMWTVPQDEFDLIAQPVHFYILALTETTDFRSDPQWIATRLGKPVIEISDALDRLERVALIQRCAGRIELKENAVSTTHDIPSAALRRSHKESLAEAARALDECAVSERDITSITFAINPDRLPEAKALIREFRRSLDLFFDGQDKTEVFNLNIQFYPVSRKGTL